MSIHILKTWPQYYSDVVSGQKTFELRSIEDRKFKVGDLLALREYDPTLKSYTGRQVTVKVTSVLEGGIFGLNREYVILSIKLLRSKFLIILEFLFFTLFALFILLTAAGLWKLLALPYWIIFANWKELTEKF